MDNISKTILKYLLSDIIHVSKFIVKKIDPICFIDITSQKLVEIILWYFKTYKGLVDEKTLNLILGKSQNLHETLQKQILLLFHEVQYLPIDPNISL